MAAKCFIDSGFLISAFDIAEPEKQEQAANLLNEIGTSGVGAVSTQIMAEFADAITHNLILSLDPDRTYQRVEELLGVWDVFVITPQVLLEAVRGMRDHNLAMRDGQVWATAKANNISIVLTESIPNGTEIEGVRFLNPFQAGFTLESI